MSPTATQPGAPADDAQASTKASQPASFDPFASHPSFKYAPNSTVRAAYPLSAKPKVPESIVRPNYAREGVRNWLGFWWQLLASRNIKVNSVVEQEGVRKAATLARQVLEEAAAAIRPGITTEEINQVVLREAFKRDCYPSPLGYHGYPAAVCTSINEIICHGIPDKRRLVDGDIINLDVTLYHHGFHGDLNATYPVGPKAEADEPSMRLIRTARECLDAAIAICGPGVPYAEIGKVIQPLAEANGCAVVKRYTGHGIGRVFHAAPTIFHHRTKKAYGIMQPGHIFTIEPMVNLGTEWRDLSWPDDWTVSTVDGAWSAAAEETLLITDTGVEILTAKGGPKHIDTRENRKRRDEEKQQRLADKRRKLEVEGDDAGGAASGSSTPISSAVPAPAASS